MSSSTPQGHHWIKAAIDQLDPETEYETIWRIMTCYRASDFMNHLIYSLTFPNFVVTEHGARVVWREDGGKVLHKPIHREEDTDQTNHVWWFYGPSDERCTKAVGKINDLHARWAKVYPGAFSDNTDYIYTLVFSAVLMHRLRLRVGLSGFSTREKIAAHHFWRDMYCEDFENTPREGTERGHLIAESIFESFAFRFFPPPLRWLGRAMPVALSLPTTLQAHKIKPINTPLKTIIIFFMACFFWIGEHILPDPKAAYCLTIENRAEAETRAWKKQRGAWDKQFEYYFSSKPGSMSGCPYHAVMESVNAPSEKKT